MFVHRTPLSEIKRAGTLVKLGWPHLSRLHFEVDKRNPTCTEYPDTAHFVRPQKVRRHCDDYEGSCEPDKQKEKNPILFYHFLHNDLLVLNISLG